MWGSQNVEGMAGFEAVSGDRATPMTLINVQANYYLQSSDQVLPTEEQSPPNPFLGRNSASSQYQTPLNGNHHYSPMQTATFLNLSDFTQSFLTKKKTLPQQQSHHHPPNTQNIHK